MNGANKSTRKLNRNFSTLTEVFHKRYKVYKDTVKMTPLSRGAVFTVYLFEFSSD